MSNASPHEPSASGPQIGGSEGHEAGHDTPHRLMEAALLVIADKGFDAAGIREIAQKAGVNSALVQYHFGGKEKLYQEAVRWVMDRLTAGRMPLPGPLDPTAKDVRSRAIESLKQHIRASLQDFLSCPTVVAGLSPELALAAQTIWHREMEHPRPGMGELILQIVRPYQEHFFQCVRILCPNLDEEGIQLMSLSVHGQMLFLHKHLELIRMLRGKSYGLEDLELLTRHFTEFSLRGLGLPEAFPAQGA